MLPKNGRWQCSVLGPQEIHRARWVGVRPNVAGASDELDADEVRVHRNRTNELRHRLEVERRERELGADGALLLWISMAHAEHEARSEYAGRP